MKLLRALFAGVFGAVVMSVAMLLLRLVGIPVSFELLLGSLVTQRSGLEQWIAGMVIHLAVGAFAGVTYAVIFEWCVQASGAAVGAGIGVCHALMAGLLMSSIPAMNPLEFDARLQAPGPFLQNLMWGPAFFVLLHCLYGACVGLAYGPTVQHEHVAAGSSHKHA